MHNEVSRQAWGLTGMAGDCQQRKLHRARHMLDHPVNLFQIQSGFVAPDLEGHPHISKTS